MGDADKNTSEREREIFFAALDKKTEGSRADYLQETCGDDDAMLGRVREMLEQHASDATETFLKPQDIPQPPGTLMEREGSTVGNYKLVKKLGEGGFGVVWMAEQEKPVQRKVALKLIKPGMDSAEVIARFGAERQALAVMDHPNIAKVFDAGATESGRPYFIMELADGVAITEFCDREKLTTKARLELFAVVCGAVQHAHQKAVIHRDLKPSNILVVDGDDGPVPKVIDFGIAKAIGEEAGAQTAFTAHGQLVGTPQYMSPEQAGMGGAADIDTRSDVYSLGVVLYELLAGAPPFDAETLRSAGFEGMCRIIREEEPPRPSIRLGTASGEDSTRIVGTRGAEPQKLSRQVRGELDWIVMKAIEKDRGRRYETANAFAADIGRYLNDEPVQAAAPSARYRIGKFVKRYRKTVSVAATIAFLLVAGIFGTSWFAVSAQKAKEDAIKKGKETEIALEKSRYEEAKALLERARMRQSENNHFAAAMMAAKALGFRGFGAERQSGEFRKQHPVLLGEEKPEFDELVKIAMAGDGASRPVWQLPISSDHGGTVAEVAFSPDGKTLANWGEDGITRLWDIATGKELRSVEMYQTLVNSLAFSPDSETLAIGGGDGGLGINAVLGLFDVSTGNEIRYLGGHSLGGVRRVAFSPDGKSLASEGYDRTSRLWDVATGKELLSFDAWSLAFSPDGNSLAIGGDTVNLCDVSTGREIDSLEGIQNEIYSLAFSPDGKTLACGGDTVKLWDVSTGKEIDSLKGIRNEVYSLAFSPDGKTLACGGGGMTLWDVSTGRELQSLQVHQGQDINSVAFSPDGKTLACGGDFATDIGWKLVEVTIWDVATGKEIDFFKGHQGEVDSVTFSPDGKLLAIGGDTEKFWDVSTGKEVAASHHSIKNAGLESLHGHHGKVNNVAFSPDGKTRASGHDDNMVKLWDVATGKGIDSLQGHLGRVNCVAFSPDGKTLASGGDDKVIKLWDVATGKGIDSLEGHLGGITCVAFSPDGKTIVSGSKDHTVKFWGVPIHGRPLGSDPPLAFSPDDTLLACASDGISLWDVSTGKLLLEILDSPEELVEGFWFGGNSNSIRRVAFSPDGKTLALASRGDHETKTINIWDVATGKKLQSLKAHQYEISGIAFSPDGSILASGGFLASGADDDHEAMIKLWDVSTGKELRSLGANSDAIRGVAFSPDGKTLASVDVEGWDGDPDGLAVASNVRSYIRLWNVSTGKEIRSIERRGGIVSCVAFGPSGETFATGGGDGRKGMIEVWDVAGGGRLQSLEGHHGGYTVVWRVAFSSDGKKLASTAQGLGEGDHVWTTKIWDVSTGKELRSLDGAVNGVVSNGWKTLASEGGEDGDGGTLLRSLGHPPLDLVAYLDAAKPWCKLEGSEIEWTTTTGDLYRNLEFEFINANPGSHLEILRSARSEGEKNRALFWSYLHAENWNSAKLMYASLTDSKERESAREMIVIKRAEKARSAFDRGLHDHARWHLKEITPLLKSEETDPVVLKAKEKIDQLEDELETVDNKAAALIEQDESGPMIIPDTPPHPLSMGDSFAGTKAGEERENSIGMKLCWIPAGRFTMGSPESEEGRQAETEAQVQVEHTHGFWIGKFEVTQGEYTEVTGNNPAKFKEVGKRAPVEMVNWHDAMDYCKKLTERERKNGMLHEGWLYTLPTEAQWEYACRAGGKGPYSGGELDEVGWYWNNSEGNRKAHEVGEKKANAWGLHDMHGNVRELCSDWFAEKLPVGEDPVGPPKGSTRVYRGGSFADGAFFCSSAIRRGDLPGHRNKELGFRAVLINTGAIVPIGKSEETDPAVLKAKEKIDQVRKELGSIEEVQKLQQAVAKDDLEGFLETDYEPLSNWLNERHRVKYSEMTPQLIFDQVPLNDIHYQTSNLPASAPLFTFDSPSISRKELLRHIANHWNLEMKYVLGDDGNPSAVSVSGLLEDEKEGN